MTLASIASEKGPTITAREERKGMSLGSEQSFVLKTSGFHSVRPEQSFVLKTSQPP